MKDKLKDIFLIINGITIQTKIYIMIFAVVFLITSLSIYIVRLSLIETLSIQLDERVKSIGSDIAARSRDLLLTNSMYELNVLAKETVLNNPEVAYVFIQDEKGNIIINTFGNESVSNQLVNINSVNSHEKYSLVKFMSERGIIRDVAVPIIEGIGGTVRVGLTQDSLVNALSKVTTSLIITMLFIMALVGVITFGLTKYLTLPLKQLVNITKEVSKGNFSVRIKNVVNDEIGILSQAFNNMLVNLEKAEKEREQYYQKIILRNRELSLLNKLNDNITTIEQMRFVLNNFLQGLVEELQFNSAVINVKIFDERETFAYSIAECNCYKNVTMTCETHVCALTDTNRYEFAINIKNINLGKLEICTMQKLDQQSLNILSSLANQLAITIENMQLWQELKQKEEIRQKLLNKVIVAQEEERKRIARELHDETSQSLTYILLELSLLENKDEIERNQSITKIRSLIKQTLKDIHDMIWQLRPTVLDKFGLFVAIEKYIKEYRNKYSIDVDLYINGENHNLLTSEIEITIYRIVQEALTNIVRYAKAENVSVIIDQIDGFLSVVVEDDGVGFDVRQLFKKDPAKDNLGLYGMQERVSIIGGTLKIESDIGKGTVIYVKVPLTVRSGVRYEENQSTLS